MYLQAAHHTRLLKLHTYCAEKDLKAYLQSSALKAIRSQTGLARPSLYSDLTTLAHNGTTTVEGCARQASDDDEEADDNLDDNAN